MASDLPMAFDRKSMRHLDLNLRQLVDMQYDFCMYKCTEKAGSMNIAGCKQNCF